VSVGFDDNQRNNGDSCRYFWVTNVATVSVIVPAYNAEKTILETIQSIQNQTFSDFEIVVINDGSRDRTVEILGTIDDPRLKVFSYENGGLPVARNRGIEKAIGQFLSFIDADDLWTPDKLAAQLAALEQHPDAGAAYSWTAYIDAESNFLYNGKPVPFDGNIYPQLLLECFIANGSNILVRRECVEAVGQFDPTLKSTEDWDFYLRLAAKYPFALVPKYQILYRRSSGSMTAKVDVMEKYNLLVAERAFQAAPVELQHLKNQSLANVYLFMVEICLGYMHDDEGVQKADQKLRKALRLYPPLLRRRKVQRLLLKIWLLRLFSYQLGATLSHQLGRIFPRAKHKPPTATKEV
jgi:glycosyltransferase involved in cell wall biosynthesis